MKKKLIAALLATTVSVAAVPFVMADEGDVEISFRVGDSILKINGVDTEVETPYIAGEGTTLVPLRVITEAFGAKVDWEGTTKTITLTYPDVNIILQIDNKIAKVNDHSETLLEAPVLSENGVTMVPLRFISETFGAEVGYDSATSAILVTKKKITNQTVVGMTEMARTGDSYYKWSIDTPQQMKMADRRLDGLSTEFQADDGSALYVDVYINTEESLTPFDEAYSKVKDLFSGYTLTEAEKLTTPSGHKYMHFQAKDKDEIVDYREYYGDDFKTYEVVSHIKNSEDTTTKDMLLSLAASFKLGEIDDQTYDLSNVSGDMRIIEDAKYKVSFSIPADFSQLATSEAENEFRFFKNSEDTTESVSLAIYSKSDTTTAQLLAQRDHDHRLKDMNPEFSTISNVMSTSGGVYRYIHEINGTAKNDSYTIDTFFEKGDYVYNMAVVVKSADDADRANAILASLQAEELDPAEIGKLLRNDPDDETLATNNFGDYTFKLPTAWKGATGALGGSNTQAATYINLSTGSVIALTLDVDSNYTKGMLTDAAKSFKKYVEDGQDNEIVKNIEYTTINKDKYAYLVYKNTNSDGIVNYITTYIKTDAKEMIVFALYEDELYYHEDGNPDFMNMLSSMTKKE